MCIGYQILSTMQHPAGRIYRTRLSEVARILGSARKQFRCSGQYVHVSTFKIRQSSPVEFWEYLRSPVHRLALSRGTSRSHCQYRTPQRRRAMFRLLAAQACLAESLTELAHTARQSDPYIVVKVVMPYKVLELPNCDMLGAMGMTRSFPLVGGLVASSLIAVCSLAIYVRVVLFLKTATNATATRCLFLVHLNLL